MTGLGAKLVSASARNESLLCVGLDPDPELMPAMKVGAFNRAIIEATQDLVCAYKPNLAFYEALGIDGWRALEETLAAIPSHIPVIADGKRGDVPNTARMYARSLFEVWGFDAATVNPYLGMDTIEPFTEYRDKGVLVVCRTSNTGSGDFQALGVDRSCGSAGRAPLFEEVARRVQSANATGNLGLVVGATYPDELRRVRELCPDLPILVPGVGAQGGALEKAVRDGVDGNGRMAIINSSRGVLYASRGPDFAEAARRAASDLRAEMRQALASAGG